MATFDNQSEQNVSGDMKTAKQVLLSREVFPVFITTFGNMFTSRLVEQTLLLYMLQASLIEDKTASFYVITRSMYLIVPIFAAAFLGDLAVRIGTGSAFAVAHLIIALGIFMIMISRENKVTFFIGYSLFAVFAALRVLRFTLVGQMVPVRHRTLALSALQVMVPVGMTLGPLLWLCYQLWQGAVSIFAPYFVVDRFFLTQLTALVINLGLGAMAYFVLRTPPRAVAPANPLHPADSGPSTYGTIEQSSSSPSFNPPSQDEISRYRRSRFIFFMFLIICTNFGFDILFVSFQPILISYFGATDSEVGRIFAIAGAITFVPPIIMAFASKHVDDRVILSFGIFLKVIAAAMFLPVFGEIQRPQVVVGHYINISSTLLVNTPFISLFTKVLGKLFSGRAIGNLWSCSNILAAVVQLLFASKFVGLFGSWAFGVFLLPLAVGMLMIFTPVGWRMLDSQSEQTRRIAS